MIPSLSDPPHTSISVPVQTAVCPFPAGDPTVLIGVQVFVVGLYLPPVLPAVPTPPLPPHTSISLPVQTAVPLPPGAPTVLRLIAQSYEDKISGVIPEHLWKEKYRKWMDEESRIKSEIKAFECTEPATTPRVKEWIEQAKALSSQYFSASHTSKRKFVELVGSNIFLRDGTIEFDWRKPWNLLPPKVEIGIWWMIQLV